MKQLMIKLKRVARTALTIAALAGASALPAQADTITGVSYRYPTYETSSTWDWVDGSLVEVTTITGISGWNDGTTEEEVTVVGSEGWINGTYMYGGWYVVTNDVTVSSRIYIDGDVHLILADGAKLTTAGFYLASQMSDCSLTIYGQAKGTGRLVATGEGGWPAIRCENSKSTVVINGGNVKLTGDGGGIATADPESDACIRINGGTVRVLSTANSASAIGDPFYLNRDLVLRFGATGDDDPAIYNPDGWEFTSYTDLVSCPGTSGSTMYVNVPHVNVYTSVPTGQPCNADNFLYDDASDNMATDIDTTDPISRTDASEPFSVLEGRTLYVKFTINADGWQFPNGSDTCYQEFVAEDDPTYVTLAEANYPVRKTTTVVPGTANHVAAAEVYTNGTVAVTGSAGNYPVLWGDTVRIIWTVSDAGYVFSNGATVYTNEVTASGTTMNVAAPKATSASAVWVCRIGETRYESIADALAAITSSSATTITLLTNVTENVTIAKSRNITLDLYGFVLKGTGSGTVVSNPNGSTFTLTDTRTANRPRHYFTEGDNNLWVWNSDAAVTDFYVDGGLVTGGKSTTSSYPGGVYANGGTLTMKNIAIVGNQIVSGSGGGVRAGNSCIFTATGCKFLHNYASNEGGAIVSPNNTAVRLYDCEVVGNKAASNGGAVRTWYNKGGSFSASNTVFRANVSGLAGGAYSGTTPVMLTDCDITGNTSGTCGAIVNTTATDKSWYPVTVAGTTTVANNTGGNVYLPSGRVLTVANGFSGQIGVTTETAPTDTTPVSITGSCAADVHTRFVSDNASYSVANAANNVVQLCLLVGIQVGDNAWAYVSDGTCTITGTGVTWAKSEWTDGNPLADVKTNIRSVVVADGVTGIGAWSFAKCYALTNVSCAASVVSVGEGAFSRCLGIERLAFAGEQANVSLGTKAVTIRAGIRMEGDTPVVWPIPTVTYGGAEPTLYGKEKLTDATWTEVTDANKANFHFFTYEP